MNAPAGTSADRDREWPAEVEKELRQGDEGRAGYRPRPAEWTADVDSVDDRVGDDSSIRHPERSRTLGRIASELFQDGGGPSLGPPDREGGIHGVQAKMMPDQLRHGSTQGL